MSETDCVEPFCSLVLGSVDTSGGADVTHLNFGKAFDTPCKLQESLVCQKSLGEGWKTGTLYFEKSYQRRVHC